jgi:tetrahydromethanopterin S-methyltransferase subunit B
MARTKRDHEQEKYDAYAKGVEEGVKHSEPSPFTRAKLDELKNNGAKTGADIAVMKNDIANIKETVSKVDKKIDKFIEASDCKIEKIKEDADDRYASKEIEKAFWKIFVGVAVTGLLALFSLLKE